jgi:hypothetical protein
MNIINTPYPLMSLDKAKIVAVAKRALMAADPLYFSWPVEQQERFRITMDDDASNRVQRILLEGLLDIQCSLDQVDDIWSDLPIAQLNPLNWARLLTTGVGENFFYLNESMADGKSLLDFSTLYDYNYDDYLFQESVKRRDFPNYEGLKYYAWQHPCWARLLINDNFYYATLTSLARHFVDEIELAGNDLIDQLIPHKYVDGADNGKAEKGGFLWDMKLDANGQEGQLDELRSRWYTYQQQRWIELCEAFSQLPPAVYTQSKEWDGDPHCSFIFNNGEALKQIRWRHFLSDCQPLMREYSTVNEQLQQEIARATAWLTENHQDVMKNFDPTVVKLKKKRKIIMTPQAMDDLDKI